MGFCNEKTISKKRATYHKTHVKGSFVTSLFSPIPPPYTYKHFHARHASVQATQATQILNAMRFLQTEYTSIYTRTL